MSDIERAMFFGKKAEESGSSVTPRRYTGGLTTSLTTVIDCNSDIDGDGTMNEAQFDEQLIQTILSLAQLRKLHLWATAASHLQEFGKTVGVQSPCKVRMV